MLDKPPYRTYIVNNPYTYVRVLLLSKKQFIAVKHVGRRQYRMKIRPLQDRVIVRRLEENEITKGGIIIPDSAKEQQAEGEVIAAGPGKKDEKGTVTPIDVKVGEIVIFDKYGGREIKVDGEDLLMMKEDDIYGVIE